MFVRAVHSKNHKLAGSSAKLRVASRVCFWCLEFRLYWVVLPVFFTTSLSGSGFQVMKHDPLRVWSIALHFLKKTYWFYFSSFQSTSKTILLQLFLIT